MKADKFIENFTKEEEGKTFEYVKREIKDIPFTKKDWDFLYEDICSDDWECANDNGLYMDDYGYRWIDCTKFGEYMEDWKQDRINDEEWEEEYRQEFKDQFERLLKIMNDNQDWNINFEEEGKKNAN